MAGKFVVLKEAAAMLGMTPDELNDLRSSGELHGYRDGVSWKFKLEEIERFAHERGIQLSQGDSGGKAKKPSHASDELISVADLEDDESSQDFDDSVLVSEEELGQSGDKTSSTVIGKEGIRGGEADSDIRLASDAASVSDSDLRLVGSGDELGKRDTDEPSEAGEADFSLSDDDDQLVLGEGSGKGSDIPLGSGDSGINLASPTDSGLSLEDEPLDLGGSTPGSSLELPEDDDVIAVDAGEEEGAERDRDFMLSPSGEIAEEESDSGSQVIALEESTDFDSSTGVVQLDSEEEVLVEETEEFTPFGPAGVAGPGVAAAPAGVPRAAAYEAPYTVWNVLGLFAVVLALGLSGILMVDIIRSMWAWQEPYAITSTLTDQIVQGLGLSR